MTEQPVDEDRLVELAEVYGLLKRDAKDMLHDLLAGVSLWRSTAYILFGVAVLAFVLVPLFVWGASAGGGSSLGLIAVFMFGLGLVTAINGLRYRRRYIGLKEKYSELYEAAKKLS
jgi:hypothetical protein